MSKLTNVIIYTDGACIENPGPGGYGVILDSEGDKKELSGGFRYTTNNRMEIMAAIIALESLTEKSRVMVFSDSQYLVKAMSQGWVRRWQKRGWKRNKRERAVNPDLWERLLNVCNAHVVEFCWIARGTNPGNIRCDQLANEAAMRPYLPADDGYENPPHRLF